MSVILPFDLVTSTCTVPKPDSTTEPDFVAAAPVVVVLAEGCGAGADDKEELAEGFGAAEVDALAEALEAPLGIGSLEVDGLAIALVEGAAKPPVATTAS